MHTYTGKKKNKGSNMYAENYKSSNYGESELNSAKTINNNNNTTTTTTITDYPNV